MTICEEGRQSLENDIRGAEKDRETEEEEEEAVREKLGQLNLDDYHGHLQTELQTNANYTKQSLEQI